MNTHVWLARGSNIPCWRRPAKPRKNAKAKGDGRPPITLLEPAQKRRQQWRDAFNAGDEDRIVAIAAHYGLPVVTRAGLLDAVRTSSPTDEPFLQVPYFMHDCKHPTGEGHTYLAQYVLARLLRELLAAAGSGPRLRRPRLPGADAAAAAAALLQGARVAEPVEPLRARQAAAAAALGTARRL